jgi:hypothetical protein
LSGFWFHAVENTLLVMYIIQYCTIFQ